MYLSTIKKEKNGAKGSENSMQVPFTATHSGKMCPDVRGKGFSIIPLQCRACMQGTRTELTNYNNITKPKPKKKGIKQARHKNK